MKSKALILFIATILMSGCVSKEQPETTTSSLPTTSTIKGVIDYTPGRADSYYAKAQTSFGNKDHKNALKNVHLAKRIYSNLTNQRGVSLCSELILHIGNELTPNLMADYYYSIATDLYRSESFGSPESRELTKMFAILARDSYKTAGDNTGVIKSDDLLIRAAGKITPPPL